MTDLDTLAERIATLERELEEARTRMETRGVLREDAEARADRYEKALTKIAEMHAPTVYQQAAIARAALAGEDA